MATNTEIASVLIELAGVYGKSERDIHTKYYLDVLAGYDADLLEQAAIQHAATNKWFPKPAELAEGARELQLERDAQGQHRASYWRLMSLLNAPIAYDELARDRSWQAFISGACEEYNPEFDEPNPAFAEVDNELLNV